MTPLLSLLSLLGGSSLSRSEEGDDEETEIDTDTSLTGTYREHLAETLILVVALVAIALVMLGVV
ncbi:MAG: hypothetical protein JRN23_04340 [Nitrososphaerota archaeon]|nr:hypothetical protein [Nitrososphaerota archaeon]